MASGSGSQLPPTGTAASTQFTTSILATVACKCERRQCGQTIEPGQHRYYFANVIENHPGKWVCGPCYHYYLSKAATTTTRQRQSEPEHESAIGGNHSARTLPDSVAIRQHVNQSQRQGGHKPQGRVTAVPQFTMGPTIKNPVQNYMSGPSGLTQQLQPESAIHTQRSHQLLPAIGYSLAHAQHAQENQRWSTYAFKGPPPLSQVGLVHLNIEVCEPGADASGNLIRVPQIKETLPVNSNISGKDLIAKVHDLLLPPLKSFCGDIPFNIHAMTLRETGGGLWLRVSATDTPHFANRFLKHPPRKKEAMPIFTAPAKPPIFGLFFEETVWNAIENRANGYSTFTAEAPTHLTEALPVQSKGKGKRRAKLSNSHRQNKKKKQLFSDDDDEDITGSQVTTSQRLDERGWWDRTPTPDLQPKGAAPSTWTQAPQKTSSTGSSIVEVSGPPIPSSKHATTKDVGHRQEFVPLDPEKFKNAVQQGGISAKKSQHVVSFICEQILLAQLPIVGIGDLIANPNQDLMLKFNGNHYFARISYDPGPNGFLGKGAFKTTMRATLQFEGKKPLTGLGSTPILPNDKAPDAALPYTVALKRVFQEKFRSKVITRLGYADEQYAISDEGKLLVWSSALLKMVYDFVWAFIAKNDPPQAPFVIEQFRFVSAAVAVAQKPLDASTSSTHRAVYLLEEMLPSPESFVKYIHNDNAKPLDFGNGNHDNLHKRKTQFLTFIQHAQYQLTHETMYVSDFQGVGHILTDPQIMTAPILGDNLFGDGNLGTAFEKFPAQHECNKFCRWFKLKALKEVTTNEPGSAA